MVFDDGKSFNQGQSTKKHSQRHGGTPLVVACAVAAFGVLGLLIADLGPWNKPKMQPAATATYSTTGEAARAAGASTELLRIVNLSINATDSFGLLYHRGHHVCFQ